MRRKRRVLNIVLLALIVLWGSLLTLLVKRERPPSSEPRKADSGLGKRERGEEWMGVYLNDKKVGWVVSLTDELEDGYRIVERSSLRLKVMGAEQTVRTLIECHADTTYGLRSLWFQFSSGEHALEVRGEMEASHFKYELSSGGKVSKSELVVSEGVYIPVSIEAIASKMGLVEGRGDSFDIFEPTTCSLTRVKVTVEGEEELLVGGRSHKARRVVVSFLGTRSTVWLDQDGSVLKEESPLGLTMIRETREEATRGGAPSEAVEVLTMYSVPSNVEIADPREVRELRVRLVGPQFGRLELTDERQKLSGDTLSVSALIPSSKRVRGADPGSFAEDLNPTPLIQSDDRKIRALVDSVLSPEEPVWSKVTELVAWVYHNVEKRPTMSIPSAVEVLEHRMGDCNEHAVLFTALARASGIPARLCGGLVCLNGEFYYHAWSKVWVGEWVAVDPTFGQSVADATHLKLTEGGMEDLLDLVGVIGKLKIEVLEYR